MPPSPPDGSHLSRVSDFGPDGSTEAIYDDWAPDYDHELVETYGYEAPATAVDAFVEHCPDRAAPIADFGCGTGLVGEELARRGYTSIDGYDISAEMLSVAAAKDVYRSLHRVDLTGPVDAETAAYAAMLCVGSMGNGHLEPEHVVELLRTVVTGGAVVLYMNASAYVPDGYEERFRTIERAGYWTIDRIEETNYMRALVRPGRLVACRRGDRPIAGPRPEASG